MKELRRNICTAVAAAGLLGGCATGPQRTAGDPPEPMNRTIYAFR